VVESASAPRVARVVLDEQPLISTVVSVAGRDIPTPAIVPPTTTSEQIRQPVQKSVAESSAHPLLEKSVAWAFSAGAHLAAKLDRQLVNSIPLPAISADRLQDSIYDELADTLARAKTRASAATADAQIARDLALRAFASQLRQDFDSEPDDSDLFGLHARKRDKLANRAIDEIHLLLSERA
jgi:hypothetical protein